METSACSYSFIRITSSQVVAKEALKTLCRMQPNVCAMVSLPPTLEQGKCRPYPGMRNEPVNMCTLLSIFGPFVTRRGGSSGGQSAAADPAPRQNYLENEVLNLRQLKCATWTFKNERHFQKGMPGGDRWRER